MSFFSNCFRDFVFTFRDLGRLMTLSHLEAPLDLGTFQAAFLLNLFNPALYLFLPRLQGHEVRYSQCLAPTDLQGCVCSFSLYSLSFSRLCILFPLPVLNSFFSFPPPCCRTHPLNFKFWLLYFLVIKFTFISSLCSSISLLGLFLKMIFLFWLC